MRVRKLSAIQSSIKMTTSPTLQNISSLSQLCHAFIPSGALWYSVGNPTLMPLVAFSSLFQHGRFLYPPESHVGFSCCLIISAPLLSSFTTVSALLSLKCFPPIPNNACCSLQLLQCLLSLLLDLFSSLSSFANFCCCPMPSSNSQSSPFGFLSSRLICCTNVV